MFIVIYSQPDGHIGSISCGDISPAEICRILNGIVAKKCTLIAFCSSQRELDEIVQSFGLMEIPKVNYSESDNKVWNEFRDELVKAYSM